MRVLFVCSGNSKNFKIIPFIKEQGDSLKEIGIHVDYFQIQGKGFLGYLKSIVEFRRFSIAKSYDLIHGHFILSGIVALFRKGKTPIVLSLMGTDAYGEYISEKRIKFSRLYLQFFTLTFQPFFNGIIAKSENIERFIYYKRIPVSIIPNGVDLEKFKPKEMDNKTVPEFNSKKNQILFLGSPKNLSKNISLLKNAMKFLSDESIELVNPYPISHNQVPEYLNAFKVLAVCSFQEGSPNLVKEAMACNCPVVCTNVGDVAWLFGDTPGYFISSFSPEDFSNKLLKAFKFADDFSRTKGRERLVELKLSKAEVAEKIKDFYTKVLLNK